MNRKTFSHFVEENLDTAYRFAYAYTKNRELAEDTVHESVIKGIKSISKLKDDSAVKTWFFRIIINTANTMFRANSKTIMVDLNAAIGEIILPEHYDDYSHIDFNDMINILPPEKRVVIVLRFYEDCKLSEIAEILSINESTVKKRLYSALETLREGG